jgi:hypothetical protein
MQTLSINMNIYDFTKNIGLFSLTLFFICTILSAAHKDDIHPMFEIDEIEKSHTLITSPPEEYWPGPTILQTSPLQNFIFWLIGWNRFQSDAQLILRQSQTKPTNF